MRKQETITVPSDLKASATMGKIKKITRSLFVSVLYGLFTLGFVFILMPRWLLPDLIWNILLVGVPAAAVIPLVRAEWYVSPFFAFVGIPVQYLILYSHAQYFAYRIGALSWSGRPGARYFFIAVTWPIFFTLVQFLVIYIARKIEKSKKSLETEER